MLSGRKALRGWRRHEAIAALVANMKFEGCSCSVEENLKLGHILGKTNKDLLCCELNE